MTTSRSSIFGFVLAMWIIVLFTCLGQLVVQVLDHGVHNQAEQESVRCV